MSSPAESASATVAPAATVVNVGSKLEEQKENHHHHHHHHKSSLKLPTVGVTFKNLNYSIRLSAAQSSHEVESVAQKYFELATLPFQIGKGIYKRTTEGANAGTSELKVLQNIDGRIAPGTMTLILAPPGHGKSCYLKALAGLLQGGVLTGEVLYGGLTMAEAQAQGIYPGHMVQYVEQLDQHLPYLTVRETFDFIHLNALVDPAQHGHPELAEQHARRVEDTLQLLSLKNCADTVVGNDLLRGISGGEKKRVTVGEGLLTNARVLLMDEISTGLDAAVTFDIVHSLRKQALADNKSVVIALLQPTPEVYALFDSVILMREGQVVYHGPRTALPGYLHELGFAVPEQALKPLGAQEASDSNSSESDSDSEAEAEVTEEVVIDKVVAAAAAVDGKPHIDVNAEPVKGDKGEGKKKKKEKSSAPDMADFLSELLFMPHKALPQAGLVDDKIPPLSTAEMVHEWRGSVLFAQMMSAPADPPLKLESDFSQAQYGHAYAHSIWAHVHLLLARQFLLMSRNKLFLGMRMFSACFMAIIFGGMYYQKSVEEGLPRYGLFLNTLMNLAFSNMSEMATAVEFKYTAYKHVANNTHPRFAYVLAAQIAHVPIALCESFLFGTILYWMTGLAPYVGNWFFFLFLGFLSNVFMGALFRCFAYALPTLQAAQSAPMPILSILIVFAGFMITRSHMGWTVIFFYIDIFGWLFRAMAQNEFLSDQFKFQPMGLIGNATVPVRLSNDTMGELYLKMFDQETDPMWKWLGVAHAVGCIAVAILASFLAFSYVRYDRNVGSARRVMEPEAELLARVRSRKQSLEAPKSPSNQINPGDGSVAIELKPVQGSSPAAAPQSPKDGAVAVDVAALAKVDARSVLPFEPMSVVFRDIKYTVTLPDGGSKCLLQGVSGYAVPGRMIALMGASGAGKTTLLDVLASRKNSGEQEGQILLNGHPKQDESFSRITSYVEQQDIHMPFTTVREALQFSAAMRLPAEVTVEQRERFIDEVLEILELADIANRKVGEAGAADGLAPGERKRLTIAVELVSNSPVVFLDEPTSSLDARSAAVVMRVIKNVAMTGRTVICTIHQPSSDLFFMFDDLLLLQKGGYMTYFGPIGQEGRTLVRFLEGMDGVKSCPPGFNPASWMLDVLAGTDSSIGASDAAGADAGSAALPQMRNRKSTMALVVSEAEQEARAQAEAEAIKAAGGELPSPKAAVTSADGGVVVAPVALPGPDLMARLLASPEWRQATQTLEALSQPRAGSKPVTFASKQARTWIEQYLMLFERNWRSYARNVGLNYGRLVALLGLNLLFGVIYFKLDANDVGGISSLVACVFMTAAFAGMINMNASIPQLVKNRAVFYREQASYMYDSHAYALANFTVELPWLAFIIICTLPVIYFMLGLSPTASVFFTHYVVTLILALVFVSLGNFCAVSLPSYEVAQAIAGLLAPLCFLFGGLFAPVPSMPPGTRWVASIDPIFYGFRALIPIHFWCDASQPGAACPLIQVPVVGKGLISMDRYAYVAKTYDVYYQDRWDNWAYMFIFIAVIQFGVFWNTRYKRFIVR